MQQLLFFKIGFLFYNPAIAIHHDTNTRLQSPLTRLLGSPLHCYFGIDKIGVTLFFIITRSLFFWCHCFAPSSIRMGVLEELS